MKIHLRKKKNKYAQVHENLLRNPNVSLKAKGLGAWLELHENGFILNFSFILQSIKEGKESVNSSLKELKECKFLLIEKFRNEKGQFCANWYFDSEGIEPYTSFPHTGDPLVDKLLQNIKAKPKNKNQKISSREREDFNKFRKRIKRQYRGEKLLKGAKGYLESTVISMSTTGYLYNEVSAKDLSREDAIELWKWMYENQDTLLPIAPCDRL